MGKFLIIQIQKINYNITCTSLLNVSENNRRLNVVTKSESFDSRNQEIDIVANIDKHLFFIYLLSYH